MQKPECLCLNIPQGNRHYHKIRFVGTDPTNGRFGEVSIWQCQTCGRLWLHYLVEYEGFTGSGRYFMGLIPQETAETITPEEAVPYLNRLEWHLYGGSYFDGTGKATGQVKPDLL